MYCQTSQIIIRKDCVYTCGEHAIVSAGLPIYATGREVVVLFNHAVVVGTGLVIIEVVYPGGPVGVEVT